MALIRKPTPTSIYAEDSAEARDARARAGAQRSRRRLVAATASAALALTGVAAVALSGSGQDYRHADAGASALAAAVAGTGGGTKAHVDVLMDGWSAKILAGSALRASVDGHDTVVPLVPATASDIAELLKTTPDALTQVLAREVTADPSLTCSGSGCHTHSGDLSPNLLLNPASIPALGPEYHGYGIDSGLYVAQVPTGGSTGTLTLSAPGFASLDVSAAPLTATGDPNEIGHRSPAADNGYLRGRYLIAAGLGRLFTPTAHWLGTGTDPAWYAAPDLTQPSPTGALAQEQADNPALVATGGLTSPGPVSAGWDETRLTYATSPSTGCGPDVICAPVPLSPVMSRDVRDQAQVCAPASAERGVLALQDVSLTVDLPAPTHQSGLDGTSGPWPDSPRLSTGRTTARFAAVGLFTGSDLQLSAGGGRVDSGHPAPVTVEQALAGVRFAGEHWHRC